LPIRVKIPREKKNSAFDLLFAVRLCLPGRFDGIGHGNWAGCRGGQGTGAVVVVFVVIAVLGQQGSREEGQENTSQKGMFHPTIQAMSSWISSRIVPVGVIGLILAQSLWSQSKPITYTEELESKAQAGDTEAQFQLGNCYFFGLGVPKKQIDGVTWYRKAAEAGHAEAQFNLGGCLWQGYGVEPNQLEAARWWRKSAGQNFAPAQISVGDCFLYGRGTEKNEAEAVRWFLKAAEQDYPAALYRLGNCYLQGTGVDRNIVEAMRYYRKAADLKYEPAIQFLHKMQEGDGG